MFKRLPDIGDLELESTTPFETAVYRREEHAKKALMLFLPFREKEDLLSNCGTYWPKFVEACDDGSIWCHGLQVLQNIQNRLCSGQMKRPMDHVEVMSSCKESTEKGKRTGTADFDFDITEVEAYFDEIVQSSLGSFDAVSNEHPRTHKVLRKRGTVVDADLIEAPLVAESVFCTTEQNGQKDKNKRDEGFSSFAQPKHASVIEFVEAALSHSPSSVGEDSGDEESSCSTNLSENERKKTPTIGQVAKDFKLDRDMKQMATHEIICATFLLDLVMLAPRPPAVVGALKPAHQQS
mmetsp:Transcript_9057/g.25506  ORF Transcript_9057/g.25506 Transcript_9057/m.25506 type:complete len:294 (-) Transcript_9057:437-1318(-)